MELELLKFIKEHEDWEALLSADPYNIKISRDAGYVMFKYNQLSSDFMNPIVRECRGIVLRESDFKPVCVPFFKFGNAGENYCPEINWETASVQQKVDGSLMKVWYDNDKWHVSTNGTIDAYKADLQSIHFNTFGDLFVEALIAGTHAFEFAEVFKIPAAYFYLSEVNAWFDKYLNKNCTYMFELVSPENRVVIPYDKTELWFLGARDNETLQEIMPESTELAKKNFFKIPTRYPLHSYDDVKKAADALPWDLEGYVVCDGNFNRVKIKSPEYVKAHYARNNSVISYERLLEVFLAGEEAEFLIYASDFKDDLKKVEKAYLDMRCEIERTIAELNPASFATQKDYALEVLTMPAWIQSFLFKWRDLDAFYKKITPAKWVELMKAAGKL